VSAAELLKEALWKYQPLSKVLAAVKQNQSLVLKGAPGALRAFTVARLVDAGHRVLWISNHSSNREEALSDLSQILDDDRVGLLVSSQSRDDFSPFEARIFRARALKSWISGKPFALIADPDSSWNPVLPQPEALNRLRLTLDTGMILSRDVLVRRLAEVGYQRVDLVENRGEFAVRGGILDIFPYTHDSPLRLEFWGEHLESLRTFDPSTQRTIEKLQNEALFLTNVEGESGADLLTYFQPGDVLLLEDPEEIALIARKAEASGTWDRLLQSGPALYWGNVGRPEIPRLDLGGIPQEDFGGMMDRLAQSLSDLTGRGAPAFMASDNQGQLERLRDLLANRGLDMMPTLFVGHLSGGFHLPGNAPSLFTDHQIFRRPRRRRTYFRLRNFSPIEHAEMLKKGDFVVHEEFGIGRFLGLATIQVGGHARECLQIEYRDNVTLYVRLEALRKVQKFSGREGFEPPLTRIGRGEWEKLRKKAREAVKELAGDLLGLYALRASTPGHAFPEDSPIQGELEANFQFEETPDQVKAIDEVKRDMEESRPMDRLVCGDVGYGKTEVALRAAFKAVVGGRQVALLVPTTLLANQHFSTFTARLGDLGVEVEMLSRFRTLSQQQQVLRLLKEGRIDVVIGTHRLLSKDVKFANLGLLIVDEEHRFGVKHKELLKKMRANVDVLVLTATPIPRTLHMALIGARDMSVIKTPPQNRLPIETEIATFSQELITGAILREIDRGGQVYFVHNRIASMAAIKHMLERWMPQVRFVAGHGQMPEKQLEKTMGDFLAGKYDVLISTMIIESGLDLPNVNTMIVNRADRFGLAQLYQLRGRIGRSNRQAYAYLLTPPSLSVADQARKRLDAIRDCSYLGAGFQLALHDLEIRGAGEIFGARQSGFIHAVGFDLYQKMLEEAVQEMGGDGHENSSAYSNANEDFEPKIEFPFDAFLPTDYVEQPEHRVELYRRLSSAQDKPALDKITEEICDRYGNPPETARHLFDLLELKIGCFRTGLARLELKDNYLLAEIHAGANHSWRERLQKIIINLEGFPIEFTGSDPPGILMRWPSAGLWQDKIARTKSFLQKLD
jgi:transcription-repair coupling factor (superfamily II helicase)